MKFIKGVKLPFVLGAVSAFLIIFGVTLTVTNFSKVVSSGGSTSKITPITDSKVEYFKFRNKKMYLSEDLEEFTMQFKGLGCKGKFEGGNITSEFEIDKIDSKDHAFYKIYAKNSDNFTIDCPIAGEISKNKFSLNFEYKPIEEKTPYVNRKIDYFRLASMAEPLEINYDKTTIKIGLNDNYKKEKIDDLDTVIKKLGEPEEKNLSVIYNNQVEDFGYTDSKYEYSFTVMDGISSDDGTEVYCLSISRR